MSSHELRIGPQGRIVIPAAVRHELDLNPGDAVVAYAEEGRLVIATRDAVLRRLRRQVADARAAGAPSPVDELLADRRAEVARETADESAGVTSAATAGASG